METPLDLVSDSYSVEISDIQDNKPLSAVGTMLRPLFLSLFAEWDCGKGMKAWRTTDTTGTLYCLNMRIKKYSTTWTEKGRACRVCASKGRLCVNIVRPGGLTVLSLPDEKRQGTADDLTYWVVIRDGNSQQVEQSQTEPGWNKAINEDRIVCHLRLL